MYLSRIGSRNMRMSRVAPSRSVLKSAAKSQRSFAAQASDMPSHLLQVPPHKLDTLENGLRIATDETGGDTVTIGVYIDAGSAYETDKNNGVAHFLEHMAFKGTQRRTRAQLEEEIENMGGHLNAYTAREHTTYYAKVLKQDAGQAIDILSDILLHSKLDDAYIANERQTILREMEEVNRDLHELVFDHLHAAAFQGTGLARTILGPKENIETLQRQDLVNYITEHYTGRRMVVSAAGALNHKEIVDLTTKSFGSLPAGTDIPSRHDALTESSPFTGSMITIRDDTLPQVHAALCFEGVSWTHPDYFAFLLLQSILGSWDHNVGAGKNVGSRLCETIATDGLASSFSSFNACFRDTGMFGAFMVSTEDKIEDLLNETLREMVRLGHTATPAELERAKLKLKTSLLMTLDGTTSVCEDIGSSYLRFGRRLTPAEMFLRIDAVTVDDIRRCAQTHFEDNCPALVGLGPLKSWPDYNVLREWTYYRRY